MAVAHSSPRTCEIVRGVRNLNCVGPGTASELTTEAPEGCMLRCFRADAKSANEARRRVRRRRFSGGP
eukprot:5192598-Alexandrium_andersonii.AAC.1